MRLAFEAQHKGRGKRRPVVTDRCTCQQDAKQRQCDYCWNEIFERNHGEAARAYYADRVMSPQSTLSGAMGIDVAGVGEGLRRHSRQDAFRQRMTDETKAAIAEREGRD
jgi:hypothetical protein